MIKKIINPEVIFATISIIVLFIIGVIVFYAISSLVKTAKIALNEGTAQKSAITNFDVKALEEIGLLRKSGEETRLPAATSSIITEEVIPTSSVPLNEE